MCPKGYYQNHTGKTRCDVCLPGFHQTQRQATACDECNAGAFTDRVSEGSNCSSCPSGFQQKLRGQALCLPCIPGKYASVNGSKSCASCPKGWLQDVVQGTRCRKAKPAHIAADGGATETEIAEGWRSINWELNKTSNTSRVYFSAGVRMAPCPAGEIGSLPPDGNCTKCAPGMTSFAGSVECRVCNKGKFANESGSPRCKNCAAGMFQPNDALPKQTLLCKVCPEGYQQNKTGESSCEDIGWKKASDCGPSEYLNMTLLDGSPITDPTQYECTPCPVGGSCLGDVVFEDIKPLFGWWYIPDDEDHPRTPPEASDGITGVKNIFHECKYAPSCPGMPNPALQKLYYDNDGVTDLAMKMPPKYAQFGQPAFRNFTFTCKTALGFKNDSRLCHGCSKLYKRLGTDECAKCPSSVQNWGFMVLGGLVILAVVMLIVSTTINSAGKQKISETVQKIMLNHLQVAALARSFPLRWPADLQWMFEVQGAISTLGDHLINPDCAVDTDSEALMFYQKQIGFAFVPFFTLIVGFAFWYAWGKLYKEPFFQKRLERDQTTPKDKFVVTICVVLYLLYPTICQSAFRMFKCERIGRDSFLEADFEEQCFTGRHLSYSLALGVGQILLFVVGMPLVLLVFLKRNRQNLDSHVTLVRFGLFYSAVSSSNSFYQD